MNANFDDAVADYADETYNPDYAAYYFFKEYVLFLRIVPDPLKFSS